MTLRLAFMGTPDFAVPVLSELVGQGHDIAAVYTQPPRKAGRGQQPRDSAVSQVAQSYGLPVFTPNSLKDEEAQRVFAELELDAAVVVAYGQILPKPVLDAPRLGCINLHASLLPRWRGAAPINRAIMAGDKESGVCTMLMDVGLDTGDVLMCERVEITERMTAGDLHDALAEVGGSLMIRTLSAMERGTVTPQPQPETGITYAAKLTKAEGEIDWALPVDEIDRTIRGLCPFPGAFFFAPGRDGNDVRIRIINAHPVEGHAEPGSVLGEDGLVVACGAGALSLDVLQRPGKAAVSAEDFRRGFPLPSGGQLPLPARADKD